MRKADILEYQRALLPKDINRDLSHVAGGLFNVLDLQAELEKRLMRASGLGKEVTVVDGGCGSGAAIEELARVMPFFQDGLNFRRQLRAIGIDLNPLPQMIDRKILEINPEDGCYGTRGKIFDCVADLREDDLETLATVPDG